MENNLTNAFLQSSIGEEANIAVKAEDIEVSSGINFSEHFFEPKVGSTYLIKFLPNPGGELITHRSVYKHLPDPTRKGKTFHYVSSGNAKTCSALELFFDLHALQKEGDAKAEKKIELYLSRTNQACVKIQILQSPIKEEIGSVRLFTFSTYGPNATVANLINAKLNPTKEKIAQGFEKEDIFNIFNSSVLSLEVTEATYGERKGRDYTKSSWAPKKRGAFVKFEDETTYEFKETDLVNGSVIPEAEKAFKEFVTLVLDEKYDVHNLFAYKEVNDPKNTKDTNDYLKSMYAKLDEIIPIIRDKSLAEIKAYGKREARTEGDKKKDAFEENVPDELAGSVMNAASPEETKTDVTETKTEKPNTSGPADNLVADILDED